VEHRYFGVAGQAVRHNLHRLDHFSRQDYTPDNRMLDVFIVEIIQTHKLLPDPLQRLIPIGRCYTGGTHWNTTPEQRNAIWTDIRADLNAGLDKLLADGDVLSQASAMPRPETRGERILTLCKEFDRGGNTVAVARRLQVEGAGTDVAYDAKQLLRLLERKRIPNLAQHEMDVARLIAHIEAVAAQLHHMP
jgi:hypothetical protein